MTFNVARLRVKELAEALNVDSPEIIAICILLKIPAASPLSSLSIEQSKEIIDYLQKTNPKIVISAGTCGGFIARDGFIGEVILADRCVFHDRRIPLEGFMKYGIGDFSVANLHAIAELSLIHISEPTRPY